MSQALPVNPLAEDLAAIVASTKQLWEPLRGQRLFITGGTGFLGCWFLEGFLWANTQLELGASATVLTRNPGAFAVKAPHLATHPAIQLWPGDVCSFAFPPGNFSHMIHAAAPASPKQNAATSEQQIQDTLVSGTMRVLDFAKRAGTSQLLFTSSGAVYGPQGAAHRFTEADAEREKGGKHPRALYGAAKAAAEQHCTQAAQESALEVKIARCFAFVGPYLPLENGYAIGDFIRDGLRGHPLSINGDGTPVRSYMYASDLMIWLWTILFQGVSTRPYNVGSEEAFSIGEIAQRVSQCFDASTVLQAAQPADAVQTVDWYVPQTQRAQAELGLKQTVSFADALRKTIAWHRGGVL